MRLNCNTVIDLIFCVSKTIDHVTIINHVFSAGDSSDEESDKPPADGSGDKKSNKSKMEKLEARVQELAAREGELMEQVYAMKLENQVNYLIAKLVNFPKNLLVNGDHLAECLFPLMKVKNNKI